MGWREQLVPGSFRGVPFEYDKIDRTGGRGVVVHNHPKGRHSTEDMGLKDRKFDLAVYVIGPFYTMQRDALIAALEAAGPGQLTIPTGGGGRYSVDSYTSSESRDEGGMCRFDITFVEAGTSPLATPVPIAAAGVMNAGLLAVSSIVGSARLSLGGAAGAAVRGAVGAARGALEI